LFYYSYSFSTVPFSGSALVELEFDAMTRTVWVEDWALSVPGLVLNLCDCLSIDQLKAYFFVPGTQLSVSDNHDLIPMTFFHALIRTHHITSRKKVAHLRKATGKYDVYALLRSGGCPGIMYCKGSEDGVREWVATVQVCYTSPFLLKTVH
jgi:hypothetical protein